MGGNAKVFQIVGYQNSGKTTLITNLLAKGASLGKRIGTIKHHGHGGVPSTSIPSKDSDRHLNAGAALSGVAGEGALLLQLPAQEWQLDTLLQLYQIFVFDLILIEGFKLAPHPKVVLLRQPQDLILLEQLDNIQAVISRFPLSQDAVSSTIPVFKIEECLTFIQWFYQTYLQKDR